MKSKLPLYLSLFCIAFLASAAFASDDKTSDASEKEHLPKLETKAIQAYDYDGKRLEFLITLDGGDRLLVYGVPDRVYEEFNVSDHKVPYFNRIIRPNFKGKRLAPRRSVEIKSAARSSACTRGMFFKAFNP